MNHGRRSAASVFFNSLLGLFNAEPGWDFSSLTDDEMYALEQLNMRIRRPR